MTEINLPTVSRKPFDYSKLERSQERLAREAAERIRGYQRAASVDIGRELLSIKDQLQHGDFIAWIEKECGFGRRTAVNLMHVAQAFGGKWESVSHLPPNLLYALAAPSTPHDFRQQVLDVSPSERVDATSLKFLLTERKRREAATRHKRRTKEPTKGQQAYKRSQEKLESQRQRVRDAENLEKDRQADGVATLIANALGNRKADALARLKQIDPFRLVRALLKRLEQPPIERSPT